MQEQNSCVWLQTGCPATFSQNQRYCTSSVRHFRTHMTRLHGVIKQGTIIRAPQGSQWPAGEHTSGRMRCISTPFKVEGSAPLLRTPYLVVLVPYIDPTPPPPSYSSHEISVLHSSLYSLPPCSESIDCIQTYQFNYTILGQSLSTSAIMRSQWPRNRCLTSARVTNSFVFHCLHTGSEIQRVFKSNE
jgi:hypothetical protein